MKLIISKRKIKKSIVIKPREVLTLTGNIDIELGIGISVSNSTPTKRYVRISK